MTGRKPLGERPHHLQIGACAMQQHDRREARVRPPQIDHIQNRARDRDPLPPRWISPLKDKNADLRQQCQRDQHRHEDD